MHWALFKDKVWGFLFFKKHSGVLPHVQAKVLGRFLQDCSPGVVESLQK